MRARSDADQAGPVYEEARILFESLDPHRKYAPQGRQRGITAASVRLQAIFRRTWLHQLPMVGDAMGHQALALLTQLEAAAQATGAAFDLEVTHIGAVLLDETEPRGGG